MLSCPRCETRLERRYDDVLCPTCGYHDWDAEGRLATAYDLDDLRALVKADGPTMTLTPEQKQVLAEDAFEQKRRASVRAYKRRRARRERRPVQLRLLK